MRISSSSNSRRRRGDQKKGRKRMANVDATLLLIREWGGGFAMRRD